MDRHRYCPLWPHRRFPIGKWGHRSPQWRSSRMLAQGCTPCTKKQQAATLTTSRGMPASLQHIGLSRQVAAGLRMHVELQPTWEACFIITGALPLYSSRLQALRQAMATPALLGAIAAVIALWDGAWDESMSVLTTGCYRNCYTMNTKKRVPGK